MAIMGLTGRNDPFFAAQNLQMYDEARINRNLLAKEFGHEAGGLTDLAIGAYLELEADSLHLAKQRDEMYKKAESSTEI